jgi:Mg2+ and Co2+ transporter CorA
MATLLVDADGVASVEELADVQSRVTAKNFFWIDLVGEDETTRSACLRLLAIEDADVSWCGRFGQSGRMNIRPQMLRASTWIADGNGKPIEIHVIGCGRGLATVWTGEAALLERVRQQFADRVGGLDGTFFLAVGILLQLLLGTLDAAILSLDVQIDLLRAALDRQGESVDFTTEARRQQTIQTLSASFGRYSSTVRAAMVGVEALPGVGERGAEELNDYVEQVEDLEEQLYERRRWMSDITHEFSTTIAQRQSEQITRLTLISTIFLPVTALSGIFGMNFEWMTNAIAGGKAFFVLGVLLPIASVAVSVGWLGRLGLLRFLFRR